MLNLKLTIFELTEEQQKAIYKADEMEITIETNLEDCDKVEMTFHVIEYVKPAGQFCIVSSGGDLFTISESAESVNQKINERKQFLFK